MAADNKLLGQFDLLGIPPAPRGLPQIEVTFDIDANGIVQVSAKDKATGKEQQIRIQASGGLSEADIQRMIKEAEANAAEDKKKRELIDARNQAESLVHATAKNLQEHGDKVPATDKAAIEGAMEALKAVMTGEDTEEIKSKTNTLAQTAMKLGEAVYKTQQTDASAAGAAAGAAGAAGAEPANKDDKVVDADFEDVTDKKKSGTG
jgi:molecular chaperone DnaK